MRCQPIQDEDLKGKEGLGMIIGKRPMIEYENGEELGRLNGHSGRLMGAGGPQCAQRGTVGWVLPFPESTHPEEHLIRIARAILACDLGASIMLRRDKRWGF